MNIGQDELEQQLKQGNLSSVYLLYGEEEFLLETCVKKIKKIFGDLMPGINYIQVDDKNISNLISDIETPAFGYEKKLIIAKKTGLFKKEPRTKKKETTKKTKTAKKSETMQDKIAQYIEENIETIKESVVLVFIEEDIGKNTLQKTIESLGKTCEFQKLKPIQISKRIKVICNGYKVNIDDATIQYFIETCGTSMLILINEIRKLIEYAGENGKITKADVDKLCIKELDSVIFNLTDSIGKKDITNSLKILNELLYNKEPIQMILITLYRHFRKLYMVQLAEEYNMGIAESLELKPNQMFLVSKYKQQARYFGKRELKTIMKRLIDLDYNSKIGLIDVNVGLESIMCLM